MKCVKSKSSSINVLSVVSNSEYDVVVLLWTH